MEKEEEKVRSDQKESADVNEGSEALELVLFQVSECYVYLVSYYYYNLILCWVFVIVRLIDLQTLVIMF